MTRFPSPRTLLGTSCLVALFALGTLSGCGDDPLLAPTSTETSGGSYGVLGFEPPAAAHGPVADDEEQALDDEEDSAPESRNPRQF